MDKNLIIIFFGIFLAIAFIVIVAYVLQKQIVERRFISKAKEPIQEKPSLEYFELSKKLKRNSGISFPTFEIKTILSVPNSNDLIVMLYYKQTFKNVLRCNSNGSIVWVAELPQSSRDVYTHLEWYEQKLRAFSASCFSVILDIETGKILSSLFTK